MVKMAIVEAACCSVEAELPQAETLGLIEYRQLRLLFPKFQPNQQPHFNFSTIVSPPLSYNGNSTNQDFSQNLHLLNRTLFIQHDCSVMLPVRIAPHAPIFS
jgi:hypothetical protein